MISLAFASLLFSQQASEGVVAIESADPLTWTLEYPYLIQPYIDDYYNCLRGQELFIGDGRSFETQHRSALPQCSKVEANAHDGATAALAKRDRSSSVDVGGLFEKIRLIHIARGKDLDNQIAMRLRSDPHVQQIKEREAAAEIAANAFANEQEQDAQKGETDALQQ